MTRSPSSLSHPESSSSSPPPPPPLLRRLAPSSGAPSEFGGRAADRAEASELSVVRLVYLSGVGEVRGGADEHAVSERRRPGEGEREGEGEG